MCLSLFCKMVPSSLVGFREHQKREVDGLGLGKRDRLLQRQGPPNLHPDPNFTPTMTGTEEKSRVGL